MTFKDFLYAHTLRQVAELAGVSIAAVDHWRKGRRQPSVQTARKLAEAVPGLSLHAIRPDIW